MASAKIEMAAVRAEALSCILDDLDSTLAALGSIDDGEPAACELARMVRRDAMGYLIAAVDLTAGISRMLSEAD